MKTFMNNLTDDDLYMSEEELLQSYQEYVSLTDGDFFSKEQIEILDELNNQQNGGYDDH